MRAALWIAWRELRARGVRLFLNVSLVSMAVALCIAMELVSTARGNAVAARIDSIGPAFKVFPKGVRSIDLARYNTGKSVLPEQAVAELRSGLSQWARAVEGRLVYMDSLEGLSVPVIGVDPEELASPSEELKHLVHGHAAIGSELARMLGRGKGSSLVLGSHRLQISSVLPASGNSEDLAVFVCLPQAQQISGLTSAVNEIRIYSLPESSPERMETYLRSESGRFSVLRTSRGEVAEEEVKDSLQLYRTALYSVAALVVGMGLMIGTWLNAEERRPELASLVAVGCTDSSVSLVLILRSIIVGLLGAFAGYVIGASFAFFQDPSSVSGSVWSLRLILIALAGTTGISILATVPATVSAVYSNDVSVLQEV